MRLEWGGLVSRPIEEVFAFMTDPFNTARRGAGTLSMHVTPPGPIAVGSTVRLRIVVLGLETRLGFVVTEWDPPHAVSGSIIDEGAARSGSVRTTAQSTPVGTRVVTRIEVEMRGIWKVLAPIAGPFMKRQSRRRLLNLERLLESGRAGGPKA